MDPNQNNTPPQQDQDSAKTTPDATENEGVEFTETPTPSERPVAPPLAKDGARQMKPWEIEEALRESGTKQTLPQQTMVIGLGEDEKKEEQTLVTGVVPQEENGAKITYEAASSLQSQNKKRKPTKLIILMITGFLLFIVVSAYAIYNL